MKEINYDKFLCKFIFCFIYFFFSFYFCLFCLFLQHFLVLFLLCKIFLHLSPLFLFFFLLCKIGFCIIACATKPLLNYNEEIQYEREFFEKDLYFLGFIILRNNIKVDSKILVKKIKSTNSNLIMATGDNPFTSLSVAMDINLVELTDDIYLCNLEDNKIEKKKSLNLYNINMNENNNINIGNERRNSFKNNTLLKRNICTKRIPIYFQKINL